MRLYALDTDRATVTFTVPAMRPPVPSTRKSLRLSESMTLSHQHTDIYLTQGLSPFQRVYLRRTTRLYTTTISSGHTIPHITVGAQGRRGKTHWHATCMGASRHCQNDAAPVIR